MTFNDIYKKTLTGVLYSSGFALTLVGLSLVTTLVIMAVTSNVVLSLGMVGALSIVRFRTAIKALLSSPQAWRPPSACACAQPRFPVHSRQRQGRPAFPWRMRRNSLIPAVS